MPAPNPKTVLVQTLLLALLVLNATKMATAFQQHAARKRPVKQVQPAPPPPETPPPPPPTMEQMPAVPPQVSFSNGLLTIVAENSSLSDILRAVRTQTGAAVEIPPNATERVVTHLGPGLPRDVLASLLNGSHFNYVVLGSPINPNKVDRVILTSKSGGVPDAGAAPMPQNNTAPVAMEEPESQQGVDIAEQPVDGADDTANDDGEKQPPGNLPQTKTPEQLLRELQMQQQQQQQQQQQPQPGAPTGQAPRP